MNNYKILKNESFRKKNRAQKKQIVLSSLAAFTFLEASIVTLAGGIYSLCTSRPVAGGILLGSAVLTGAAAEYCKLYAKTIDVKNNIMVNNQMVGLKEKYEDAKYRAEILRLR